MNAKPWTVGRVLKLAFNLSIVLGAFVFGSLTLTATTSFEGIGVVTELIFWLAGSLLVLSTIGIVALNVRARTPRWRRGTMPVRPGGWSEVQVFLLFVAFFAVVFTAVYYATVIEPRIWLNLMAWGIRTTDAILDIVFYNVTTFVVFVFGGIAMVTFGLSVIVGPAILRAARRAYHWLARRT